MKREGILIAIIIPCIFLMLVISSVEGSFVCNNQSIAKTYTAGDAIRGIFNLTFQNEPASSLFTSNFPGNITLIELIKNNSEEQGFEEGFDYNCTIKNCVSGYVASNEISSSFSIGTGEKKLIGFNISGEQASIQSLKIKLSSDAPSSCIEQLGLNVLNNYHYELSNAKYTNDKCGTRYTGCFDESSASERAELTRNPNSPYCEKITLPASPAYKIGAKIYNSTKNTNAPITASIYDLNWNLIGSCTLPNNTAHFEELSCIAETPRTDQEDYLVCISAKAGVDSNYTIPTEQQSPVCGNSERGSDEYTRDYNIFAEAMKYDSVSIELNDSNFNKETGENLLSTLNAYLEDTYDSNCKNGCSVPVSLLGGLSQNVNIQSAEVKYNTKGTIITSNKLYLMDEKNSTISSIPLALNIEYANFTIPSNTKETHFNLYLGGTRVYLPINLSIGTSFDFDIEPKIVTIGFSSLFKVGLSGNVSSVVWDFGDGTTLTTSGKNATHTYSEQKTYDMTIKVTREKDGIASTKKFSINVIGAREASAKLLNESINKTDELDRQISAYPSWISPQIRESVNISYIKERLNEIKAERNEAVTDDEYAVVIQEILELSIPSSISSSVRGSEPLITGLQNANMDFIKEISNSSGNDDELKKKILEWINNNYDAIVEREVISSFSGGEPTPILTKFSIKLNKKSSGDAPAYFIIAIPKSYISFQQDYGAHDVQTGADEGIWISVDESKDLNFAVPEDISLTSVGAYLSPDIKKLSLVNPNVPDIPPNRTGWAIFWICLVIIVTLGAYISLQEWYKRKYEGYLFPNADGLYNVINFIYNSRVSGIQDNEIRKKLENSGWKKEQINYALKKIDGKRTGMWEIPFFKFIENKKVKEEIQRRQGGPINASFIKRPEF